MKILIFSDSHGKATLMQKAVALHPDAEYLLHLGDGVDDIEYVKQISPTIKILCVNGNFEDSFFNKRAGNSFRCIEICGKRIFMCHGHRYNVSFTDRNMIYAALENGADIVLYGHTHVKHNEYIPHDRLGVSDRENGLYIFNPGSISRPRDGVFASFGLLEIQDSGILLSHGTIKY